MAINFPDSPSNGDTTTLAGKTYTYDSSKGKWSPSGAITLSSLSVGAEGTASGDGAIAYNGAGVFSYTPPVIGGTGVTVHANQSAMLTDAASADEGTLHYENNLNKLYAKAQSGFFLLATISNVAPTIDSFTETTGSGSANTITDGGLFTLTAGTNTVITLGASDSNLDTLSFSATLLSGTASNVISSPSLPVSNQSGNTFTLTPSTSVGGTIQIRFDVTDGTNVTSKSHSFTIGFAIVNSRYTSLLIESNAAGNNSSILDSNTQVTAKNLSVLGSPTQGSFSPYSKKGYSVEFDGSDSFYVDGTAIGTSAFTFDVWIKPDDRANYRSFAAFRQSAVSDGTSFTFGTNSSGQIYLYDTAFSATSTTVIPINSWTHFCCTRASNGALKFYINGSLETITKANGTTGTEVTITRNVSDGRYNVGGHAYDSYFFQGEIRDYRVIIGSATAPPSGGPDEPLTSPSGTELLLCAAPYLGDKNTQETPKILTIVGDPKTVVSGPYDAPSESEITDGSSITCTAADVLYVNNSTDFIPNQSGGWTAECWVRFDDPSNIGYSFIMSSASGTGNYNPWWFFGTHPSGYWRVNLGNGTPTHFSSTSVKANVWYHVAIVSDGSTNATAWVNGEVLQNSTSMTQASANTGIIFNNIYTNLNSWPLSMTISDHRYVSGSQVYTLNTAFTSPTSPLAAITNTKLLLSGTGTKVFDKAQAGNLGLNNAVGVQATSSSTPAQINSNDYANTYIVDCSSATKYVTAPDNGGLDGAFTIESYMYITQSISASYSGIIGTHPSASGAGYLAFVASGAKLDFYTGAGTGHAEPIWNSLTIPINQWFHIAIQRSATNYFSLYISGVKQTSGDNNYATGTQAASGTVFNNNHNDLYYITRWHSDGYSLSAYLQDFRISDGLERYTTNFTPHTAPLKG